MSESGDVHKLITDLVFAEAGKNENFDEDVKGIATVVLNRMAKPQRFGMTAEQVIFSPNQFSAIGGKEWEKTQTGNFTPEEEKFYKRAAQLVSGIIKGTIKSDAKDADHYYNPKLANPSWGKVYPKVYDSGNHRFLKEVAIAPKKKRVSVPKVQQITV